jgi:hypothetical protein
VLALIVNQEGFPFSYEMFEGNRADVSTVEAILRTVERKHGKARRVWIFDRGVVSEENLVAIRKRGGEYLVGTPRSKLKQFEAELLKDDFEKIRPDVAFLGYALLVTLKHLLKRAGSEHSPAKVLKRLSELYSVDIVLPTIEGREIFLRRISKLDEEQ